MSPELSQAIERTKKLFKTRDHSEDWGRNIIDGSKGIHTQEDWTLYYSYLTNPHRFDPTKKLETVDPNYKIEGLPEGLEEVRHKNGTDIIIEYKRVRSLDEDDEKREF